MLRQITEDNNGITVKCKTILTDELPTFAGVSMIFLDNIMRKPIGEKLVGDKIMIGNETNIIKDSLVSVDDEGNVNLPLDTRVFINSQPILFQDNADSSMYKVEVDKAIIGSELKTNNITNITTLDNMAIQSDGEIKIKSTKSSSGVKLISNSGNASQVAICNDTNETKQLVMSYDILKDRGTLFAIQQGVTVKDNEIEIVGSKVYTPSEVRLIKEINQLIFNLLEAGNLIILNASSPAVSRVYTLSDVGASADFIMSQGAQTKTSALTLVDQLKCNSSAVIKANGHIITGGTALTSSYNHFLQSKTETLAGIDDIMYFQGASDGVAWNPSATTIKYLTYLNGVGFSKLVFIAEVDSGTTGQLLMIDSFTSNVIATINITGSGTPVIEMTTSFSNLPALDTLIEFVWGRTVGAGGCVLYFFVLIRDI
jgi:hypothetical protein